MSEDREAIRDLIGRVEKASGPDREIDARVALLCGEIELRQTNQGHYFSLRRSDESYSFASGCGDKDLAIKVLASCSASLLSYTADLNAVIALIERKLRGSLWCVGDMEDGTFARIITPNKRGDYVGQQEHFATSEPPALALLLAFLRALSQEPTHDR
jgi:hypothetical protein